MRNEKVCTGWVLLILLIIIRTKKQYTDTLMAGNCV